MKITIYRNIFIAGGQVADSLQVRRSAFYMLRKTRRSIIPCGSPTVRLLCIFNDFIKLPGARTGANPPTSAISITAPISGDCLALGSGASFESAK